MFAGGRALEEDSFETHSSFPCKDMAVWLDAWYDPVASIHTVASCIRLVDVTGDGDPKLLVADQNRKLRLYKGEFHPGDLPLMCPPISFTAVCCLETKGEKAPLAQSRNISASIFLRYCNFSAKKKHLVHFNRHE